MKTYADYENAFGAAVRQARIRKGLPLEDVAERANLSPTSVRALELGRGSTLATLTKVLRVLDETGFIEDWAAEQRSFSPIAALRETRGKEKAPQRVSRRRRRTRVGGHGV
jgi:transcriptional regulator with XRE-family HTH domain